MKQQLAAGDGVPATPEQVRLPFARVSKRSTDPEGWSSQYRRPRLLVGGERKRLVSVVEGLKDEIMFVPIVIAQADFSLAQRSARAPGAVGSGFRKHVVRRDHRESFDGLP